MLLAYGPRVEEGERDGVTYTRNLVWLLSESDYVSHHVPLTTETRGMVDAAFLRRMRPDAFLICTARGAVIDEHVPAALQGELPPHIVNPEVLGRAKSAGLGRLSGRLPVGQRHALPLHARRTASCP